MWPILHPDVPLRMWSLFVTLGVVLAWVFFMRRATRLGYPRGRVLGWLVSAFPVGAVAAALGAGLVRLALGRTDTVALGDASTGMTVLGAVVGVFLYSLAYIRWVLKTPVWPLLDAAAFTYPLALGFGRIGCLFNGCCFGITTDTLPVPLAIPLDAYHPSTLAATSHLHLGAPADALLVNLPLLLVLGAAVTLVIAERLFRHRERLGLPAGFVLLATLVADGLTRVLIEFARAEATPGTNPWQLWVLAILVVAAIGLVYLWRRRTPPTITPTEHNHA